MAKKSPRGPATGSRGTAPGSRGAAPAPEPRAARARTPAATDRDARTQQKVTTLAGEVAARAFAGQEPVIQVPTRARSNTLWNKKRGILQMGDARQERQLFNLGQARLFMQTMLHANSIRQLIDADKTLSLRAMFYKGLHTVAGTSEKTFGDQDESDGVLEDLEVTLGALREELHIFAKKAGTMVGNITIIDSGDEIDCRRMGSGGYAIPSIVEPDVIRFKKCEAKFVLHVEKNTVWSRFNEDRFWEKHNCILTEGGGQPPRGVRRLLRRLNQELGLPIYCLLDCDPWGHYIYSVLKQGSISLAFESERLAIPEAKFVGIRAKDYRQCELTDDVQIELTETDIKRAREIAGYPWFQGHKGWQREIQGLLDNGFKMEVESLITKDISYVSEVYVPQRLAAQDWLD
ncbi:MAG TPA: DNA topoisomerase IV subunit A [Phycisphaerales bacterium]|nr:DNA topoisomerase IV subunit A [Phycisphaerales bacterium]